MDINLLKVTNEIRFISFFIAFIVFMGLEFVFPRRKLIIPKFKRWLSNLSITIINNLLLRIFFPGMLVGVSIYSQNNNIGILNYIDTPVSFDIFFSVLCLDLAIYSQHVAFHKFNILWALHKVHHVDLDLDVTTGLRFHPIEILISLWIKSIIILLIGVPPLGIIIFQILLNITSMFNHSNIKLSKFIDKKLRLVIVTPDMHIVHHSDISKESNSNFGFNLSIWDRLFKTYLSEPKLGVDSVDIGVLSYKKPKYSISILTILWLPFRKKI